VARTVGWFALAPALWCCAAFDHVQADARGPAGIAAGQLPG